MKHILTLLAAAALALGAGAQQEGHRNHVGMTFGGGLNTMTYSTVHGEQSLRMGFGAGPHYAHYFNANFGLGFGLQYARAYAQTVYQFTETSTGLTHADNPGVVYDLSTNYDGWKERQSVGFLGIPVEALWRTTLSEGLSLIAGAGLRLDIPTGGSYSADGGSYSTTGYFPATGHTVSNQPQHGFSTYGIDKKSDIGNLATSVSLLADLGLRKSLDEKWGLYFGIYASYGLGNFLKEKSTSPVVELNTADASKIVYNGTFASNETDAAHLLCIGAKVGVDFGWGEAPQRRKAQSGLTPAGPIVQQPGVASKPTSAEKAEAERAARERAEADRAAEKAETERIARAKAEAERKAWEESPEGIQQALDAIDITFESADDEPWFDYKADSTVTALCGHMKRNPDLKVTVTGHTDNTGSHSTNMKYGLRRAKALKAYLVEMGAPADRIKCVSKGPDEPIAPNNTKEGRARNRRVNVKVEK